MQTEEQRAQLRTWLARHEAIAAETRQRLYAVVREHLDPLSDVDAEFRRSVEDEFYAERGLERYTTSDGRTKWLSPEQIERRRTAGPRRPAPAQRDQRQLMLWAVNVGASMIAVVLIYLVVFR